jgi:tRNA uridine 5-carbamoylmethylation protein Kti12
MKLVIIYGPPAVGKLTTAQELAKIIDYKLIHNHLSANLVASIFDFGTPEFHKLNDKFQLSMIEAAAKANVKGLIFTKSYIEGKHESFFKSLIKKIRKHKARACFVRLFSDEKTLMKRVRHDSRKHHGKLINPELLNAILQKEKRQSIIPFVKSLQIDNTKLKPKVVALRIKRHYKL